MKIKFWLLDINPRIEEGKPAELWLWGIDSDGNRVLVIDRNFTAYFYAVLKDGFDPASTAKEILDSCPTSIVKAEVAERRFFGKPVHALKVYCKAPSEIGKLAKQLRGFEAVKDCLEDDIRVPMQYLIDNDVSPSSWLEVDAEQVDKAPKLRVDKVYLASSVPKQVGTVEKPTLRTLSFSMVSYSREGSPQPDRNPVVIISAVTSDGEKKQFVAGDDMDDKPLIQQFVDYVCTFDPDVILSFGGNAEYWDYLSRRSRRLQRTFDIDRAYKEPHTSVYGHVSFAGIANVDLADFMDVFPEVKVQSLANLANYLGIMKDVSAAEIEDVEFADYWDDKKKREQLREFSLNNACKIHGCAALLLDFAVQLSSLVSLPLDHVMTAAVGFRVEWFLIKMTRKIGELVPRRIEQPYRPYAGGLVLQPKPGLHDDIAVLDFKSMYPNIMIHYNLSPDTYVAPGRT